jgi:hypothetical protein
MSYKKTGELPPALANKPDITPDYAFYLNSFFFLSKFRGSSGYGPNPLSLSDIWEFCRKVGFHDADMQFFFADIMHACDSVYLAEADKEAERRRNKRNTSNNSGAKRYAAATRRR